jgi:hypothetical protein
MIRSNGPVPPVIIEFPAGPTESVEAQQERERHLRNLNWFSRHAVEIGRNHPGKFVCVAGEELFVGTVPEEVLSRAVEKHPEDRGATFSKYIPTHRGPKVYAN